MANFLILGRVEKTFLFYGFLLAMSGGAHVSGAVASSLSTSNLGICGDKNHSGYRSIRAIQGEEVASPLLNKWVVTEGVVTLSLQGKNQYRGFWLQQTDSLIGEKSSSGIFVYYDGQPVKSGQIIRLLAQVAEYHGLTEFRKVKALKSCAFDASLPKAIKITLPVVSITELEALEGMRVFLRQDLVVSDLYGAGNGLGNYGQFAISSQLHSQPTERFSAAQLRENKNLLPVKALDYLLIDDASAKPFPSFIPYPTSAGFSADNAVRITDRLKYVKGVLHAYGEYYMVIPDSVSGIEIKPARLRSKEPAVSKSANLVIASLNLSNYFNGDRINNDQKNRGFPTVRGARSYRGFLLQTEKIVSALSAMDADIIGLMEVENDGYGSYSAIQDLTRALNKGVSAKGKYHFIRPPPDLLNDGRLGSDVISVGLLYRPNKVKVKRLAKVLNTRTSHNSLFDDTRNRPSLIQRFEFKGQEFIIGVNHFKSKSRPCDEVEFDTLQGNCNITRYKAALALGNFLQQQGSGSLPTLILGDLNSYSQEDPLLALYDLGFHNLKYRTDLSNLSNMPSFSYSFQGLLGNLDHALANEAFLPFIESLDSWHINSIEDVLLDYKREDNGHSFPSLDIYGSGDAYRSSDHDPVVLGLQFPDAIN